MVRHEMLFKVALVSKLMSTQPTSELLCAVMPVSKVASKVSLLAQTFTTDRTAVLEETLVNGGVVKAQIVERAQGLATRSTAKRLASVGVAQRVVAGRLWPAETLQHSLQSRRLHLHATYNFMYRWK
jgi:hypothetical protein